MAKSSWTAAQSVRKLKAELHDGTGLLDKLVLQNDPVAFLNATKNGDSGTQYTNVSTQRLQSMLYRYARGASLAPTWSVHRNQFARQLGEIEKKALQQGQSPAVAMAKALGIDPAALPNGNGAAMPAFSKTALSRAAQKQDDAKRMDAVAAAIVSALCERETLRKSGRVIEPSANILQADEKTLRQKTKLSRVGNLVSFGAFGLYKGIMMLPQVVAGVVMGAGMLIFGTPLFLLEGLFNSVKYGAKGKSEWKEMKQELAALKQQVASQATQPVGANAAAARGMSRAPSYTTNAPAYAGHGVWNS